tara:strand:+ start:8942 stop:9928 length:987 start_codon:yes stop_codon:yes gene_type:complete
MYFISEYGMFLLKSVTIVAAILIVLLGIVAILSKGKGGVGGKLEVKKLNEHFANLRKQLQHKMLSKKDLKKTLKLEQKMEKKVAKDDKKRVFVLDFNGDMKASGTTQLREEVSAVLTIATPEDEVIVRVESPGGIVNGYGLAASQLQRFRDHNIPLTVAVDKVAASGGYMMACVADKILAAPFAIIGSIGVVAQIPNFHRWLKKHDIEFEQLTAGDYKRTLTMFGENTKKDREKAQADIEDIHMLFKDFVSEHRPQVDLAKVATGEYWFGTRAKALNLIDELQTSDDYLMALEQHAKVYTVKQTVKKGFMKKLGHSVQQAFTTDINAF